LVVAAFLRIPPSDWEELRVRSLQRQHRPERVAAVAAAEKFAAAATSAPSGKLNAPPAPIVNRVARRRNEVRALRRSHRHA
jgi:hypothetical protein